MAIKDLKANRIRISRIIGSGSRVAYGSPLATAGGSPHTVVMSASNASNFTGGFVNTATLDAVGRDVGLFISGTTGQRSRWNAGSSTYGQGGVTLVGGDLHVSGNISVTGTGMNSTGSFNEPKVGGFFVTTASVSLAGNQGFTYSADTEGSDTFFFVSGSRTRSGSADRSDVNGPAVSVFGGDLVVSGTLYAERQVVEVDQRVDGAFFVSGAMVVSQSVTTPTLMVSGAIDSAIAATIHGGGRLDFGGAGTTYIYGGATGTALYIEANDSLYTYIDQVFSVIGAGDESSFKTLTTHAEFNQANFPYDFKVNSDNKAGIIFVSGSKDFVSFGPDITVGLDSFFIVSGSVGSKGSATDRGTAVFGGDLCVSGNNYIGGTLGIGTSLPAGVLDVKGDGSSSQIFLLSGSGAAADSDEKNYTDLAVFVSGAIASKDTSTKGVSVFGGDVVISGSLHGGYDSTAGATTLQIIAGEQGLYGAGAGAAAHTPGADEFLFISGSTGNKDSLVKGTSVFGGDVVISGSLYGSSPLIVGDSLTVTGSAEVTLGLSGSLTRLVDGTSYLVAGAGINIASASNGAVTITNDGTVGDITAVTAGIGLSGGGTSGPVTLNIRNNVVATLTGSQFSGNVGITGSLGATLGLSGSLTRLTDGSSYLIAGSNTTIVSASNGAITVTSTDTTYTAGDGLDLSGTTFSTDLKAAGGLKIDSTELAIDDSIVATISGSTFTGAVRFNSGLSGSITRLHDGSSYLVAGSGITITSASNGAVTIVGTAVSAEWTDEGTILRPNEGIAENVGVGGTGAVAGEYGAMLFGSTGNVVSKGFMSASLGLSGSLTRLTDGSSYLIAGNGITITSASNGAVTLSSVEGDMDWTDGGGKMYTTSSLSIGFNAYVDAYDGVVPLPSAMTDAFFVASGSIGSKDSVTRGTSIFRGDTVVSGAFHINPSGDNTLPVAGVPTFSINTVYGEAIGVTSGLDVVINESGNAGIDFRVESAGEDEAIFLDSNVNTLYINKGETGFITSIANTSDEVLLVDGYGATFNQDGHASIDFRVESDTKQGAILLDAGTNQLGLLTNGISSATAYGLNAGSDPIPSDTNIFVSGAIGSKISGVKGTTAFGGDMIVSGTLYTEGSLQVDGSSIFGNATADDITFTGRAASSLLPKTDNAYDLGGPSNRWANIYTGDLHLRNDKGNWTIQEEADKLIVINNLTGKKYKMMLSPLEDEE